MPPIKLKIKLPPRPVLPSSNEHATAGPDVGISGVAAPSMPLPAQQQQLHAVPGPFPNAGAPASVQPAAQQQQQHDDRKRKAEHEADEAPAKRPNVGQPTNGASSLSTMPSLPTGVPVIRKITLKRPVAAASSVQAPPVPAVVAPVVMPVVMPATLDKAQQKQLKEQQKQVAKEEQQRAKVAAAEAKQRQKDEAAQEKQRQKQEAEQEKRRAQDQANFLKTIKLKIVQGNSSGSGAAAAPSPGPAAVTATATQPMAPTDMFLSSTKSPGKVLKPKIKIGVRPAGSSPASAGKGSTGSGRPTAASNLGPRHNSTATGGGDITPAQAGHAASGHVDPAALDKILLKVQAKDARKIFLKPVTEALAPNYFAVIKQPMDFTTMRQKIAAGAYRTWEDMQADLDLIFTNCMTYNSAGSIYHLEAKKMQEVARRLVELGKKGETNFRGRTAGIVKTHNAHIHAAMHANAAKPLGRGMRHHGDGGGSGAAASGGPSHVPGAIRAAQVAAGVQHPSGPRNAGAAPDFHFLHHGHSAPPRQTRAGRGGRGGGMGAGIVRRPNSNINAHLHLLDVSMDGDARQTYHARAAAPSVPFSAWTALSNGASADGLPWANGRLSLGTALPPGASNPTVYLSSVARFTARCSAAVRRAAMGRLQSCVAVEGVVLPPEPDPVPEPVPQPSQPVPHQPHRPGAVGMGGRPPPLALAPGQAGQRPAGGPGGIPGLGAAGRPGAPRAGPAMSGGVPALNLGQSTPQQAEMLKQALALLGNLTQGNNPQTQALAQLMAAGGGKPPVSPVGMPGAAGAPNPLAAFVLQQLQAQAAQQQQAAAAKQLLGAAGLPLGQQQQQQHGQQQYLTPLQQQRQQQQVQQHQQQQLQHQQQHTNAGAGVAGGVKAAPSGLQLQQQQQLAAAQALGLLPNMLAQQQQRPAPS